LGNQFLQCFVEHYQAVSVALGHGENSVFWHLSSLSLSTGHFYVALIGHSHVAATLTFIHSPKIKSRATLPAHVNHSLMISKQNQQVVRVSGTVAGHIIDGTVTFSPAPPPGILAELAKFEAQRLLTHMVEEEILAGPL
jgi:hypothetical protein